MPITTQIPAGPKNLATMFPSVNFAQVQEYYLEVREIDNQEILATTPTYKAACCCNSDSCRIFFVNYLGAVDSVPGSVRVKKLTTTSSLWQQSEKYPLEKAAGGFQRFGVTGKETRTIEIPCYNSEPDQPWLAELMTTPNAWIQWTGTQGQADDYLPILITDGDFELQHEDDRFDYALRIDVVLSNDRSLLRN